jgi:uncharacterized protein (DUF58 family)
MYRKSKKKHDPLLLLSLFVGLGVIVSTLIQRSTTDQDVPRDLSHTPITIKNESLSLDTDNLVKVTETHQRTQAKRSTDIESGAEAAEQQSITINKTRIYRF